MREPVAKEHTNPGATDKAAGKLGSEAATRQPKQKGPKAVTDRRQGPATGTKHSAGPALKQTAQNGPRPDGKRAGQPRTTGQKAGQQASLGTQLDPASRRESKKALAQAKQAPDGRAAKAPEDIGAEDRIEGWRAQLQETQNAAHDARAPAQPPLGRSLSLTPGQYSALLEAASHAHLHQWSALGAAPSLPSTVCMN